MLLRSVTEVLLQTFLNAFFAAKVALSISFLLDLAALINGLPSGGS
jgi:hypothetical protein